MNPQPIIGRSDYVAFCQALDLEPDLKLRPVKRRASLPPGISHEAIQTAAAVQKFRAWLRANPQPWDDTPADPAAVLVAIAASGDVVITHMIARVLARLPAPVLEYVVRQCSFLGVGLSIGGFCSAPIDVAQRPWLIVIGAGVDDAAVSATIAHEVGHAWLLPEPAPGLTCQSAIRHHTEYQLSMDRVPTDLQSVVSQHRDYYDFHEGQVERLVRAWGFEDK